MTRFLLTMGRQALCLAALLACSTLDPPPSAAAAPSAPMVLRLADGMPSGHVIDRLIIEPFIQEVEKRTNGQVRIQHFPAEQLGKSRDLLIMTQRGVTDIGFVVPSYMSDKMPLTAVTELPGIFKNTCQGNAALRSLTEPGGVLETEEFTPNGIRPLIIFLMPAYQLVLSSTRPLRSLADADGLKIRTPGGAMDPTVLGINAVPIRISPPEIYESMARGTLDGALLAYQSVTSYHLAPLIRSGTVGEDFGTVTITFSISERRWATLPDEVKAIMTDVGRNLSEKACAAFDAAEEASLAKMRSQGVRLITPGAEDKEALSHAFAEIRGRWAAELDGRGKPGSQVLKAFTEAAALAATSDASPPAERH